MKKITFLLLLLVFSFQAMAQVLNQPAGWPNTNWTVTGTYLTGPDIFESDPTLTANFSYDDDDAGFSAITNIAAESPVVDLTAAFNAGETWLFLNASYVYSNIGSDFIAIEYWNADTSTWMNWGPSINTDTPGALFDNYCGGPSAPFNSGELNITGFSASQLSGFKYRIRFDDGGGWVWGFCFQSPTIISQEPPACPNPSGLVATNASTDGVQLSWTENGSATLYNIEIVPTGTIPSGIATSTGVSNPYLVSGLNPITTYNFYVQAQCGGEDTSSWIGVGTFTTLCSVFTPDYNAAFNTFLQDCWDEADSGTPTTGPSDFGISQWVADGFANNGSIGANNINLYSDTRSDWLLSPLFDLTGGPFQVELDLAIMDYGSSSVAGILGSDDQVQLLITTDNGATWVALLSWDNNSVLPVGGDHYVSDLSTYTGQTVQFAVWASEGTVNDDEDNDISFDNFRVRSVPTCAEPTVLTANNLSLTSTEIGWTENGGSAIWNIEYGPTGFTQGTGTILNDVTTNPYVLTGLTADTAYEFYVQANCGAEGLSSWRGPASIYAGYCVSIPSSNDGQGVSNVTIGSADFPSFGDVTYENHTTTPVNVFQGIQTSVAITFATGYSYETNIWIDFNDNLTFESSELVYQGESTNANPTTLDATFIMPADAAIGEHRMRIGTADSGQSPPDPCYNGPYGVTLDFTINVLVLDCVLAEAQFTAVADCANNNFFIEVNVTSLGDATSLALTNNHDSASVQAFASGVYQVGPFAYGTNVRVFVTNEQNSNCTLSSTTLSIIGCPPSNDNCVDATVAVVNEDFTCEFTTPGTILAASPSSVSLGSCPGSPDDDVWFQFTALHEAELISILDITGGTSDLVVGLYSGDCGNLTELFCSDDNANFAQNLVIGNSYYVRVFSYGSVPETSSFNLCIKKAPENLFCDNAVNFCGNGGALYADSVVGVPDIGAIACLSSVQNPAWNIIQIGEGGRIDLRIVQNTEFDADGNAVGNGLDVDYALWGPFTTLQDACANLTYGCPTPDDCPGIPYQPEFYPYGNIIDCSWSADAIETATIDNAIAGEIYVLLVSNFANSPGTIQIQQTNAGSTGAGSTIAEIQVDLGGDQDLCGYDSYDLTAVSPYADQYEWYLDGIQIEGETGPTLTVTESNTYTVKVIDEQCGSEAYASATITFNTEPVANIVTDIVTCDDISDDGFEAFDLEAQTATILGTQDASLFNVTYHLSQSDANTGTGALTSPYTNTSSPQTIYVRVENAASPSCRASQNISFNLVITGATPTATSVDIALCDMGSRDGKEAFDLAAHNVNILNGQSATDYAVSYYASEADANASTNALTATYTNISNPQTIWARVDNVNAVSCYAIVDFDLIVDDIPVTTFATDIAYEVCPDATVPIIVTATPQNYTAGEVTIVWSHDGGVIAGQTGLTLPVLMGGLYEIQVTYNETGCPADAVGVNVVQLESCEFPQGISPGVSPGLNDTFDLSNFDVSKIEIFNRLGTLVYSKDNYTDEWHGQTNNGDELPVGTYFYTITYSNGTKTRSSWVYINK